MPFDTIQFFLFFCVVYGLYLILPFRRQNSMLLIASCIFYGAWNWKFLPLMFVSISTDYFCSNYMAVSTDVKRRKGLLFLSIFVNLSILCVFKYFNFFSDSLYHLLAFFHIATHPFLLKVILPVGISFYTFEAISYTVDVYYKRTTPAKNFWDYALFVIYFPHLVAGPIMRAKDFLPQIATPRQLSWDKFFEGCYLIFWGLFLKIYVANNLGPMVDQVFGQAPPYNGGIVWGALYAFAFQIFADFAGYSNMARGLGKCMGFDIVFNFNLPYFSKDPAEFWQRWHISLSQWMRDYIYIPLGGNRHGALNTIRNLFITMFIAGLWHGASWTFVMWGVYHAALLIIYHLIDPSIARFYATLSACGKKVFDGLRIIIFFHLVCLGWLFFRADSWAQVVSMWQALTGIFHSFAPQLIFAFLPYVALLLVVQTIKYVKNDLMAIYRSNVGIRVLVYYLIAVHLIIWGNYGAKAFIYFQF